MKKLTLLFVMSLLLAACSSEKDSQEVKREKAVQEAEKNLKDEKVTTEVKEEKSIASDNKVYGMNLDKDAKDNGAFFINEKKQIKYIGDVSNIIQIEKEFDPALGLNLKMDKDFLTNHAMDFMESDSKQIEQIDDHTFIYESKKIMKKYEVDFVSDNGESINRVIVSQHE